MDYIVEMLGIRKEFPGIVANDDITLQLEKGEIHALLGENGAGKSTLMGMLFGMYSPDRGAIKIRGIEAKISSPTTATELGIGMVHQHFKLVHNFTTTENIILGIEPTKGLKIDIHTAAKRVAELSEKYGLSIDPYAKIEDISVGMQQRVEIIKMLYRNADILIFDEPTAVLTPQEIEDLMAIMCHLVQEGKSIILITHKLKEIKAIADRCTIIRRGKYIDTVPVSTTSLEDMAKMMVGRPVSFKVPKKPPILGKAVLDVKNLSVKNQKNVLGLKNFSLTAYGGEIVGIAGIDGNGQSELVEALTGLRKTESGTIMLCDEKITHLSTRQRIQKGIAHIPEDRHKRGLVLDYTLQDNMILERYDQPPFSHHGLLNPNAIHEYSEQIISAFDVRSGEGGKSMARSLSGGNQQKAIVGRELELNPELLIAVQPTRGLDVGSIEYIHKRLIAHRDKGKAVLLVSLELDEILHIADRIAVLNNGELVGIVDAATTNENQIGLMMAGIKGGDTHA
ncbi:MAG: ABC transporter ATP-binding protein [Cellulosilyticaceae bacterium]